MSDEVVIPIRGEDDELAAALDSAVKQVEDFGNSSIFQAAGAGAAFAATTVVLQEVWGAVKNLTSAVVDFGTSSVMESLKFRQSMDDLDTVLGRMGDSAGVTGDNMRELAGYINDSTRFTREQSVEAQRLLTQFDEIDGSQFNRVALASADLAAAIGGDLIPTTQGLARSLENPAQAAAQLRKMNVFLTDEQQSLIAAFDKVGDRASAQEVVLRAVEDQYKGLAQEITGNDTAFDRWGDAVADAKRALGDMFLPILDALTPALDIARKMLSNTTDYIRDMTEATDDGSGVISQATEWIVESYKQLAEMTAWVVAAVQTGWENMGDAVRYVALSTVSAAVTTWEDLKFFFTDTMPTVLNWFLDNWEDIWSDAAQLLRVVTENMFINLGAFTENLIKFFTGNPERYEFRALTEGFERTLQTLPDIAARELTPLEESLRQQMADAAEGMVAGFEDRLLAARGFLGLIEEQADEAVHAIERTRDARRELDIEGLVRAMGEDDQGQDQGQDQGRAAGIESFEAMTQRIQSSAASIEDQRHDEVVDKLGEIAGLAELQRAIADDQAQEGRGQNDATLQTLEEVARGEADGNRILADIRTGIMETNRSIRTMNLQPGVLAE